MIKSAKILRRFRRACAPHWRGALLGRHALLWSAVLAGLANADTMDPGYRDSPGSKAIAMVPDRPQTKTTVTAQANDVAAATNAQAGCEAKRRADEPACELIWINAEPIATGAQILRSLPDSPHPLYLWRYQSPTATLYLAGSIHILKPSLYPLPAQFEQAFTAAQRLVVEVNLNRYSPMAIQKSTMSRALLPEGQTLLAVLPEQVYQRTAQALARHGIDIALVNRGKPAMVMQQLLLARLTAIGYPPTSGVEQHFLQRAGDREIQELETLDAQLDLLFNQPLDLQQQLLADTLDQADDVDELMTRMIQAWLSGDDKQLLELFEQQTGDSAAAQAFNEQLLDARNRDMVEKIKAYLTGHGTSLIIIGAAHYIGSAGIIELLNQAGIHGQRINSDTQL